MNDKLNLSKEQLEALLKEAAKSSNTDTATIKNAVDTGKLDSVLKNLSPKQAQKLQSVLSDKQSAMQMLNTPQARSLLARFLEGGKNG